MALNILHLSDLHIGNGHVDLKRLPKTICTSLDRNDKIHQIVFTGDIFDASVNNSTGAINSAVDFFNELITQINKRQGVCLNKTDILFVPGNHEILQKEKENDLFDGYKKFLTQFYGEPLPSIYGDKSLTVFKKFDDEKIAIVGFNSACYDKEKKRSYGEIDLDHRDEIDEKIYSGCSEYALVVLMHHHFYTIEERDKSYKDYSNVVNSESFFNWLNKYNVTVILHGHKHDNFISRININKDLSSSDKIITTVAGGSVNKNDVSINSFNVIRVYPPESSLELDVSEYQKKNTDTFDYKNEYSFPIRKNTKVGTMLTNILNKHDQCKKKWEEIWKISSNSVEYIDLLNRIIPQCAKCCERLEYEKDKSSIAFMFAVAR